MNWIKTAALLSLVLVLGVRAQADSLPKSYRNSQSAILTGVFGLHTISPSKAPKTSSPASLRASATKPNFGFTAFIPGQGRVRFRFRKNRKLDVVPVFEENGITRPDPKGVTLLQGDYLLKAAKGAAAASIYTPISTPRLFAAFAARSLRSGRLRYFRVELPLTDKLKTSATAQVRRLPSHAMLRKTCGGKLLAQLSPDELSMDKESHTPTLARAVSSNTIQIVQLGIEADSAWYQIYKSNSNAALSTFLNEAETLYERQLSLTYQITRQVVYTNRSFGTSQAEEKLKAYQKYTLGKSYFGASDAFHLFTGETLQNNVIGLSFLGVICRSKTSSFGLTQSTNSLMIPITFAHELAHNFNATHDESYPPTIMFPAITNPPSQVFSEFSRKEIRDFVARYGSRCLTPKGGTPTPSPTPNPTDSPRPTAYPTKKPTATPTSTPSGPGGGKSGGGPPPVRVSFKAKLGPKGNLALTVNLNAPRPECRIVIQGSLRQAVSADLSNYVSFSGARSSRILKGKFRARPTQARPVYLIARARCKDGAVGSSRLIPINPGRLTKVRRSVDFNTWLASLRRILRKASKK